MFVVWDEDSYIPNIIIAPSVIPGTTAFDGREPLWIAPVY